MDAAVTGNGKRREELESSGRVAEDEPGFARCRGRGPVTGIGGRKEPADYFRVFR